MVIYSRRAASGDFAFRAGLPGEEHVGADIRAIVLKRAAIAIWSPGCMQMATYWPAQSRSKRSRATGWAAF